eukprot:TRINITY_DN1994_c0_g1_i4.p1 TRINITY_DN1994_c0_g1~~TRINITY_DN1994_c0_g1_i4.p1  ORF type:complete len:530 (-),score=146.93 TRINITY_DN1994_c0_g1_i4:362-1951(-)
MGVTVSIVLAIFFIKLAARMIRTRRSILELRDSPIAQSCQPHWLFGHMLDVYVEHGADRFEYLAHVMHSQGARSLLIEHLLPDRAPAELIVTDPASVKHILKDNFDNYIKHHTDHSEFAYNTSLFFGDGIFATSHGPHAEDQGKRWYMQRKITAQMFTASEFKNFIFDTFATTSDTLVSQLETERESGKPVDLQAYFFKYTMDSFGLIAFNAEFRTLEGETAEYGEAFDGAHESVAMFFRKFALLATLLEVFDEKSWLRKAIEAVVHPLIPEIQRLKKERRTMREYTAKVIADRKSCTNEERLASKDILGMFIKAAEEQEIAQSDEYLTDVVLNLVIAGRDTTACLLSWTFYELARHPDVLRTLREHLEGVDVDDFHSIKHQPYLTALLYEVSRLWPSVPVDSSIAAEDDVLPDGTKVKARCWVSYSPYVQGRDPLLWPEPDQLRPERFLEDGKFVAPSYYDYPVFQAGPRICLGMNFAIMEASLATAKLLNHFDFELTCKEPLQPDTDKFTMSIRDGLNVRLKRRQRV